MQSYSIQSWDLIKNYLCKHKPAKFIAAILTLLAVLIPDVQAAVIYGRLLDAESDEPLIVANIQLLETYRGSITNADGEFALRIDSFPAKILFTYIGYIPVELELSEAPDSDLEIYLEPALLEGQEIIITAEDPAVRIMQAVITRKLDWQADLSSYRANAYCRTTFTNDSSIILIAETLTESWWDEQLGSYDVIQASRQTAGEDNPFIPSPGKQPNFYLDHVDVAGFDMISVVHPDALTYYKFKLLGERIINDQTIFEISVEPATKFQPAFQGTISVLDDDFALLAINLETSDQLIFPMPIQAARYSFKQEFRSFDNRYWLPVSLVREARVKVGMPGLQFNPMNFKDIMEIRDYEINIEVPEDYFDIDMSGTMTKHMPNNNEQIFDGNYIVVPLTIAEKNVYASPDSSFRFFESFGASGILGSLLKKTEAEEIAADTVESQDDEFPFLPELWYNRVEGFHYGIEVPYQINPELKLNIYGGYSQSLEKPNYGIEFQSGFFSVEYHNSCDPRFDSQVYPQFLTSVLSLTDSKDYCDFIWTQKLRASAPIELQNYDLKFGVGIAHEINSPLNKSTDYTIISNQITKIVNPNINASTLSSIDFAVQFGPESRSLGLLGQRSAIFKIEYSSPLLFNSDLTYFKSSLNIDWRWETFLKRRMLANTLDVRLTAMTSGGDLPWQKHGSLDVSLGAFNAFGAFKSLTKRPLESEQHLALFWEHNFRTLPFEMLGADFPAQKNIEIILHGASGRTWISQEKLRNANYTVEYPNQMINEIGFSINKLFYIFRLDLTTRVNEKAYFITISLPRFN